MHKLRHTLNLASIAGLASYLLFIAYFYLLNLNPLGPIKYVSLSVTAYLLYLAIKHYRDTELEGFGKFNQLFMPGVIFSFVYSSLIGMLVYLHTSMLDVSVVEFVIRDGLESVGEFKEVMLNYMDKDEYQKLIDQYESLSPSVLALTDFQSKSITTLVLALIYSLILRKSRPIFNEGE
jgi:hypothetical protein